MPSKVIKDVSGGYSARDPQTIKDNQFAKLVNFYYDQDKRLITRRGYETYFDPVPDTVVLLDACNVTTGWSVALDGANLAAGSAIRGTNSLEFDVDVSADVSDIADLIKSTISADISTAKGYLGFWLYVPSGFNTDLTDVKVRLGTDSSNYYEWTLGTLTEGANNFVKLNYDDATSTGTLNDASIAYFRLRISYVSAYTDKSNILVDSIYSYSATSVEPIQGYHFTYDTANEKKITIAIAGANAFHWNETGWDVINTGLTKYETMTGLTTHRTRWGSFAYNGSGTIEVGLGNGIDSYRTWNGVVMTAHAAQPKCKYFMYNEDSDRIYSGGAPEAPITLYYTNAAAANAQTLNTNDVDIGTETSGDITGIFKLGEIALVGKEFKIFYVDPGNFTAPAIDPYTGLFSNRAIAEVGNGILYQSANGIDNLMQKQGSIGAQAIVTESYSSDIQERFKEIAAKQRNANCGYYLKELTNYYFSFDSSNDNKPDTTFVYSALVSDKGGTGWTEYNYPAIYLFGRYVDSSFNDIHLFGSANAGQFYRMESGFTDDGSLIESEFITKLWNMNSPNIWKDVRSITIIGLKNKGSNYTFEVLVEGDIIYTATLTDSYLTDESTPETTIGTHAIATQSIGGGGASGSTVESIDLYKYSITLGGTVFGAGRNIQIRGYGGDDKLTVFSLEQYQITYEDNTQDIIPLSNYA